MRRAEIRARVGPAAALVALALALVAAGCRDAERPESGAPTPSAAPGTPAASADWSEAERSLLVSMSLSALPPPPPSPSNRVADDEDAARLGHRLFFDPGLSRDGSVSCASCHVPSLRFTDGRATSRGIGDTSRNAPTLVGVAHSPWQFWDGRRDSLWSQALAPLEAGVEMGTTRVAVARHLAADPVLAAHYERVFGPLPDLEDARRFPPGAGPFGEPGERDAWYRMDEADRRAIDTVFANTGKALGAYERRLMPAPARFDRWVEAVRSGREPEPDDRLTDDELAGLRLFLDARRTLCLRCHNGPLFTNHAFHDVGTAAGDGPIPDFGRYLGLQAVLVDPFNCLGPYSDAPPDECRELRFLDRRHTDGELGKFKTPTLRGLSRTAPYMHDGRIATLQEVMDHYRSPPLASDPLEITPLEIDDAEAASLVAFLRTLDDALDASDPWLSPPSSHPR